MSYLRKMFSTGAVRKTPPKVIRALLSQLGSAPGIIVEFGAGKGEITRPLLERFPAVRLLAFERDAALAAELKESRPGLEMLVADAFAFPEFMKPGEKADAFVCALPLSFFPKENLRMFFKQQRDLLNDAGVITIVFHAPWLIPFLRTELPGGKLRAFATVPPYFLYSWRPR